MCGDGQLCWDCFHNKAFSDKLLAVIPVQVMHLSVYFF